MERGEECRGFAGTAKPLKILRPNIMRIIIISVLVTAMSYSALWAAENISAQIKDGWVIATQGSDESSQVVRVKIWGPNRIQGKFYQLDTDSEKEFVVRSRG